MHQHSIDEKVCDKDKTHSSFNVASKKAQKEIKNINPNISSKFKS